MDGLDIPKFDFTTSVATQPEAPVDSVEMGLKEESIFGAPAGFNPEIPSTTVGGKTISDFINESQQYNMQIEGMLQGVQSQQNYSTKQEAFNPDRAISNLEQSLSRPTPTFERLKQGMNLGSGSDLDRYAQSGNFQAFGYTPFQGAEQEYKYGRAMTWGDTVGRALGGASELAWGTFAEGWKGWGRMTDALFSWDASKLMGSEEDRYDIAKEQEAIFNKYAIFDTEASKDSIWNRQMFGNMLQQAGFAVGAGAQFAMEAYLTAGVGSLITSGVKSIALAKGIKNLASAGELINDVRKVTSTLTRSEKVVSALSSLPKKIIPLYGTVQDLTKLSKAGAGTLQLATAGAGAIKRELSMFNMARSEAIFESASTYANLKDRLIQEHIDSTGYAPDSETLEKISQTAENASYDNFKTNSGVLLLMNRLQFDNMTKSFNGTRKLFNEGVSDLADEAFTVSAKVGDKQVRKAYQKGWFFGELGAVGQISKDFGKKTAAWEATKMLGKGFTKIEGSEGVQELLQTASGEGLEKYYYDLYHGNKGYSGKLDAVMSNFRNPATDMEGAKTFIMGALTGALISPGAKIISRANQKIDEKFKQKGDTEYKSLDDRVEESVKLVNTLYENPAQFKQEWIANIKVQNKLAETMEEAAKNHNKYVYYNAKDSAFSKAIASAIKLDMFESARDTIKELGEDMTNEEFEQAFSMNPNAQNRKDVKDFMGTIATNMEDYYTTYYNLKDKYGDKILPDLYRNNDPKEYKKMILAKKALDEAIEVLTTNVYKAKQTAKRATELQSKMSSKPNLSGSAIELLTKMGSEQALGMNLVSLEKEIQELESRDELGAEEKELLKNKKEELKLSEMWADSYEDIMVNDEEGYSPAAEKRAYESYRDLLNLYNTVNKRNVTVTKEDVDESFIDFIDYIRLNKDSKDYVDAMNVLADPSNLDLFIDATMSAMTSVNQMFKKEHEEEIRRINGTESKEEIPFPEEATEEQPAAEEKVGVPTLNDYLKEKYATLKQNPNFPDITYEKWVSTGAANAYIKEYNKKYAKEETLESLLSVIKKETKTPKAKQLAAETKDTKEPIKVRVNGASGVISNQGVTADNVKFVEYTLDNGEKGIAYVVNGKFRDGVDFNNSEIVNFQVVKKEAPKTVEDLVKEFESGKKMMFDFTEEEQAQINEYLQKAEEASKEVEPVESVDIEAKKADILERKEKDKMPSLPSRENGKTATQYDKELEQWSNRQREYDAELAALEGGKKESAFLDTIDTENQPSVTEELEEVEDYDQSTLRTRRDMEKESIESASEFQVGLRQVNPADSLANTTEIPVLTPGTVKTYTRGPVNENYPFIMATGGFKPGAVVSYKIDTDYSVDIADRIGPSFTKDQVFNADGTVKPDMYDHVRIGVYSIIDGKETLIGHVHTPQWISYMIDGKFPHIVIPDSETGSSNPKTLQEEVAKSKELRKQIIDSFNINPNFVYMGSVTDKSLGVLRTVDEQGLLKDRVNPAIGKGGQNNPHGKFAIVRKGVLESDKGLVVDNHVVTKSFESDSISSLEGVPVLLLPTPIGSFFPTFVSLPKVNDGQIEFIVKAWEAFNNPLNDPLKIIPAVYKALGLEAGDSPDINVLREYITSYITNLNKNPLSPTGTGEGITKSGIARINISEKGSLFIQAKDNSGEYHDVVFNKNKPVTSEAKDLMRYLLTTVRFSGNNTQGINSETPVDFLQVIDGKLVKQTMPYNEHLMNNARTFVDRGIVPTEYDSNIEDWIYFGNPVVKLSITNTSTENKPSVDTVETTTEPVADPAVLDEPRENAAQKLLALKKAKQLSDDQIEERKKECGGGVGRMQDIG